MEENVWLMVASRLVSVLFLFHEQLKCTQNGEIFQTIEVVFSLVLGSSQIEITR